MIINQISSGETDREEADMASKYGLFYINKINGHIQNKERSSFNKKQLAIKYYTSNGPGYTGYTDPAYDLQSYVSYDGDTVIEVNTFNLTTAVIELSGTTRGVDFETSVLNGRYSQAATPRSMLVPDGNFTFEGYPAVQWYNQNNDTIKSISFIYLDEPEKITGTISNFQKDDIDNKYFDVRVNESKEIRIDYAWNKNYHPVPAIFFTKMVKA